jgi:hypothetical protein
LGLHQGHLIFAGGCDASGDNGHTNELASLVVDLFLPDVGRIGDGAAA